MADLAPDSRFLQNLTDRFARDAAQLIGEIEAAMIRKDQNQFRELMHALKGAAMMAGAVRLRDSPAHVETLCTDDFANVSPSIIEELREH
jgi:HPt (histidine-containing phosphotransfer) domain-containing protein